MKLMVISGIVLALIIASGVLANASIARLCEDTGQDMERIISLAEEEDWSGAAALLEQDIKKWQNKKALFAVVQHHEIYDGLHAALMRAKQYAVFGEGALLAGEAAALTVILDDVMSFDRLTLENIF